MFILSFVMYTITNCGRNSSIMFCKQRFVVQNESMIGFVISLLAKEKTA